VALSRLDQLHRQHAPPFLPVDAQGHQYGPAADYAILADLLIARIEDQIRVVLVQFPGGPLLEFDVELLVDPSTALRAGSG